MRKSAIIFAAALSWALLSCKKETGNSGVIKNEETKTETHRYVASDGSGALVTFTEENGEKYMSVKSNNKTIRVKEQKNENGTAFYDENGVQAQKRGDSVIIYQDNIEIGLKKAGAAK